MSTLVKFGKRVTWDKFWEKIKDFILENFINAEDILCVTTDLQEPSTDFKARQLLVYLTEDKEKILFKQKILEIKLKNTLTERTSCKKINTRCMK